MHNYVKLRNAIAQRQSYNDFRRKFQRYNPSHAKQLNLLLQYAIEQKVRHFNMYLTLILHKGADINYIVDQQQKTLLMLACQQTNLQIVTALLEHEDINMSLVNHRGQNALFYAIKNRQKCDRLAIVKRLLNENELVEQTKNSKFISILFRLIQLSYPQLLKLFCQKKYDCDEQKDQSLLYEAFNAYNYKQTKESKQCIEVLLEYIDKAKFTKQYEKKLKESFSQLLKQFKQLFIEVKHLDQEIKPQKLSSTSDYIPKQPRSMDLNKKILQVNGNNTILHNGCPNRQDSKLQNDQKQTKHQKSHSHQNTKTIKNHKNSKKYQYKEKWETATIISQKDNKKKITCYKEKIQQKNDFPINFDDEDKIMRQTCDQSVRQMSNLDLMQLSQELLNIKNQFLSLVDQQQSSDDQYQYSKQEFIYQSQSQFAQIPNYLSISQEILQFATECQSQRAIGWHRIAPFYQYLQKIAKKTRMTIDIIGSFANTLWLPYCDIDFIFMPYNEDPINLDNTLEIIFKQLKNVKQKLKIVEIYFNKSPTFPTIKLQLSELFNHQKIDIAIFYRNNNGKKYVTEIIKALNIFPAIKPIFFYLRRISQLYMLHDQKIGGLKTYALFLLIFQAIRYWPDCSLGQILERISFYYGFCYQYDYQIENNDLMMKLNIIDPLNINNNVGGKKTQTSKMQKMFKSIYYGIHRVHNQPLIPYLVQLSQIL